MFKIIIHKIFKKRKKYKFRFFLKSIDQRFRKGRQEDAEEFLNYILDKIYEIDQNIKNKFKIELIEINDEKKETKFIRT